MNNQWTHFTKCLTTTFSLLILTNIFVPVPVNSQPELTMNRQDQLSFSGEFEFVPQDGRRVPEETKP